MQAFEDLGADNTTAHSPVHTTHHSQADLSPRVSPVLPACINPAPAPPPPHLAKADRQVMHHLVLLAYTHLHLQPSPPHPPHLAQADQKVIHRLLVLPLSFGSCSRRRLGHPPLHLLLRNPRGRSSDSSGLLQLGSWRCGRVLLQLLQLLRRLFELGLGVTKLPLQGE